MLSKAVGTKSISQIKNYYYDYKKQSGKYTIKTEKKTSKSENNTPKSGSSDFPPQDDGDDVDDVQEDATAHPADVNPPYFPNLGSEKQKVLGRSLQNVDVATPPEPALPTSLRNVSDSAQLENLTFQESQDRIGTTQRIAHEAFVTDPENHLDAITSSRNDGFVGGDGQVANLRASQHGLAERLLSASADFNGGIQQLLNQQAQQRHGHQLDLQLRQQQQQQPQQQPQSALQQLLSRQHHQRERQQQASHRSLEETRRLLHQQSQSHHQQQQVLSNLFPPWSAGSQLLQAQSRMQQAQLAAAFQQEGGSIGSSVSDLSGGMYYLYRGEVAHRNCNGF
jgi:hypothetical protein